VVPRKNKEAVLGMRVCCKTHKHHTTKHKHTPPKVTIHGLHQCVTSAATYHYRHIFRPSIDFRRRIVISLLFFCFIYIIFSPTFKHLQIGLPFSTLFVSSLKMSLETTGNDAIVVIGAGLAGACSACLFGQRGERVVVVELREDWREEDAKANEAVQASAGSGSAFGALTDAKSRSINLALSVRGSAALKTVGVYDDLEPTLIPMHGRAVHVDSKINLQPYGHTGQHINSVGRLDLNNVLLNKACAMDNVTVLFGMKLTALGKNGDVTLQSVNGGDSITWSPKLVVGSDGGMY
jgi:FAD binding domain